MTTDQQAQLASLVVRLIALGRVAIGVVATLAPGMASRLQFRTASPKLTTAVRMLGARDLALGVGALLAERHGSAALRGWAEAGALADGVDAVAFATSGRRAGARASGLATLVAASAAVCGAVAARGIADLDADDAGAGAATEGYVR